MNRLNVNFGTTCGRCHAAENAALGGRSLWSWTQSLWALCSVKKRRPIWIFKIKLLVFYTSGKSGWGMLLFTLHQVYKLYSRVFQRLHVTQYLSSRRPSPPKYHGQLQSKSGLKLVSVALVIFVNAFVHCKMNFFFTPILKKYKFIQLFGVHTQCMTG